MALVKWRLESSSKVAPLSTLGGDSNLEVESRLKALKRSVLEHGVG